MSLIFYCAPMSTATVTELVLAELDTPHETVRMDIKRGDTKKPEFLALNPNGKVPVIVHEGTVIWESSAITMYLGETFGVEKGLYPAAGPKRGEAMKWIAWSNVTMIEAASRWARNASPLAPPEQRNAQAAEVAMKDMHNCLRVLDAALKDRAFLCGEYSLVDTHVNGLVHWFRYLKVDMTAYGHVEAWGKRCMERPAHVRVMSEGHK